MTTFLNGKPGIIDLIRQERDKNVSKLTSTGLSVKRHQNLQAEVGAFNLLLAWLDGDDVVLLTEAEYAQRFPTVPDWQHATYAPEQAVDEDECDGCEHHRHEHFTNSGACSHVSSDGSETECECKEFIEPGERFQ